MRRQPQTPRPVKGRLLSLPWPASFSVEIFEPSWRKYKYATHWPVPMKLQISPEILAVNPISTGMTRIGNTCAQKSFEERRHTAQYMSGL